MSRTYLQLCQDAVRDVGMTGGVLTTAVISALTSQEQIRMCGWVAYADLYVQNLWTDWNFLWYLDSALTLPAGSDTITPNRTAQALDREAMVLNYGQNTAYWPAWLDWPTFYRMWQIRPKLTALNPSNWSQDPSGKIWFSHYAQNSVPVALPYWLVPTPLVNNTDISPVPTRFDRIIVERAKILYAEREDAPEILSGSTAEYMDLLDKLQSYALPDGIAARTSRNNSTTIPPIEIG